MSHYLRDRCNPAITWLRLRPRMARTTHVCLGEHEAFVDCKKQQIGMGRRQALAAYVLKTLLISFSAPITQRKPAYKNNIVSSRRCPYQTISSMPAPSFVLFIVTPSRIRHSTITAKPDLHISSFLRIKVTPTCI